MFRPTIEDIENNIKEAREQGVPESKLAQLIEYVEELKSGKLPSSTETGLYYKESIRDGKRIVEMASAPILSKDGDSDGVLEKLRSRAKQRPAKSY